MADEPIEPQEYLFGVKVVDIGDVRVSRGLTRRPVSSCQHHSLVYDTKERRIWCRDCEKDVDPFDAFELLTEHFHRQEEKLAERARKLKEAEQFQIRTLAAKEIDKAWRSRKMVPACPHCRNGLFPEDFKSGIKTSLGRDYALARLGRKDK